MHGDLCSHSNSDVVRALQDLQPPGNSCRKEDIFNVAPKKLYFTYECLKSRRVSIIIGTLTVIKTSPWFVFRYLCLSSDDRNSPSTESLARLLVLLTFTKGLCVAQKYIPSSSNVTLKRCRVPEVFCWAPPPKAPCSQSQDVFTLFSLNLNKQRVNDSTFQCPASCFPCFHSLIVSGC